MSTLAEELASALAQGTCLLETSSTPSNSPDLKTVLHSRLLEYYACLKSQDGVKELRESSTSEEMQFLTAKEALSVVQKVHNILDIEDAKTPDQVPSIGTRDLAQLRTLLSLIFKWGIEPLFNRVTLALPIINTANTKAKIVDVSQGSDDYRFLSEFVISVFLLIFPRGVQGQISQTLITTTILHRHVSDLLSPSIALGWLPEPLSSSSFPIIHEMRSYVIHLLKLYVWNYFQTDSLNDCPSAYPLHRQYRPLGLSYLRPPWHMFVKLALLSLRNNFLGRMASKDY